MSLQSLLYEMQGLRVKHMTEGEIASVALPVAKRLKFTKWHRQRHHFEQMLENLTEVVNLEVLAEDEWKELTLNLSKGHFSPNELTIRIPESTYLLACEGDKDSLEIVLHELGHAFLMHQVYLHKADKPPTRFEDPEWQADTFAEIILSEMGYPINKQLELELQM